MSFTDSGNSSEIENDIEGISGETSVQTMEFQSSGAFVPRTTKPTTTEANARYWYDKNVNFFYGLGDGDEYLNQCTWYAYGRAYEILGTKPNLSPKGAGTWFAYNKNNNIYPFSSDINQPKLGAIACYNNHVAVVESFNDEGKAIVSESGNGLAKWNYFRGDLCVEHTDGFQGYIYLLDSPVESNVHNPRGRLDSVTGGTGSITVGGWAYDPDAPEQSIDIHVYIGGPAGSSEALGYVISADQWRQDVGEAHPEAGNNHGFSETIVTEKTGVQDVYVYAINVGEGSSNTQIGTGTVTITPSSNNIAEGEIKESYGEITWKIDKEGKLTVEGWGDYGKKDDGEVDYYDPSFRRPWFSYTEEIKSAKIVVTGMTDASDLFFGCPNLSSVDLSEFDTRNVTDMSEMFFGCSSLSSLDVSNFDTSKVTSMERMFEGCSNLSSLDISNFDTSNVTDMYAMFEDCENLTSLDVSNFDTGKVTHMGYMFARCYNLSKLDVGNFDTSQVITMSGMFGGCENLTSLDVSRFDTSNVEVIYAMFNGCRNLLNLDVSGFDTSKVTFMSYMFGDCYNLSKLDVGNFDTSKVTDMAGMFCGLSVSRLDLSSFDTSQVTNMENMFRDCKNLMDLDLSSFDCSNVTDAKYMFLGSTALTELRAPVNVCVTVELPMNNGDAWYFQNGTTTTMIPMNRKTSVYLRKNEIPQNVYDKIRDWSSTITIPAGESRHLEYIVKRSGDYLYQAGADVELSWQEPRRRQGSISREEINIDGKEYIGFSVRMDAGTENIPLRFTLENMGEDENLLTPVTNTDFSVTEVREGQNLVMSGKTGYYSFTPDTYGCYQFASGSNAVSSETSVSIAWVYEQSTGSAVSGTEEPSGRVVLETGKTYLFRVEGEPGAAFTAVKKLSEEFAGNEVTVQGGGCYAFIPSEAGYYGSVDSLEGGELYHPETGEWEHWEGNQIPEKLEAGEIYLFSVEGKGGSIRLAPRKQVTVFDYHYYQDFIAAGGSVSVDADGKATVNQGKAKWKLKSYELPLFVIGGTTYGSLPTDAFAEANLYWGTDVGIFDRADCYSLDGTAKAESGIQDGDVILAKYHPEVIWVQSMKLKCSKSAMEPGDIAQMTAELKKGQEKYDFTEEPVIRWESSNPKVAEVDADTGEVTAHAAGTVTITAYADEARKEQEGISKVVKASLPMKIAAIKKTFSKISTWKDSVTVGATQTKYFSFQTKNAGDYLIEIPEGVKFKSYNAENVEYQEVQVGGKTYVCGTFSGGEEGTWRFEIWNTDVQEPAVLRLATHWELAKSVGLGDAVLVPAAGGSLPIYCYYAFAPEKSGVYTVEGAPDWACKKDGSSLGDSDMLLASGELCCMRFTGGEGPGSFAIRKNTEYEVLENTGGAQTFLLDSGQKYLYVPEKTGTCTAFTSRLGSGEIQMQYLGGEGWTDWPVYTETTGNYSLSVSAGKTYGLLAATADGSPITVALPGYKNPNGTLNSSFKITSLTDVQLAGQGSASRMSAAYKASGAAYTASGTLKYVYNCSNYLGSNNTYKSGYFLALRLNVQKEKFRDGGYVSVSYLDREGNRQKHFYEYSDAGSTLKDGYVDLVLDLSNGLSETQIRVAPDAFTNIKTYQLNLGNLKMEESGKFGMITEPAEKEGYGVKTSAPVIKRDAEGNAEVLYDSVSYSGKIALPDGEGRKGNYIALKVEMPDSMKNTKAGYSYQITNLGSASAVENLVAYAGIPEGASYVLFLMDAKKTSAIFGKTLEITWGVLDEEGNPVAGTDSFTQSIMIKKTKNCYFEAIPAGAALPKSIAFNGLSTTMYAGQSQNIATTINRKYEEDLIRLSYSTSDSSVLSVNRVTGVVQALKAGTATVTVEAVDIEGNSVSKSAKITVKNPTAPGSMKVSGIRDTSVTVSWAKNVTGQRFEIYAVPYDEVYDAKTRKTAAQWKTYIETELNQISGQDAPAWAESCVTVTSTALKAEISGLKTDTPYLFYVRNVADTAAGTQVSSGSLSGKTATKKVIFDSIRLVPQIQTKDASGKNPVITDISDGSSFTVEKDDKLGAENLPNKISYQLLDEEGKEIQESSIFTSVAYKSSNANVVKVDKNGNLTLGGQAGTAKIYVTGKDTAGTARTSEEGAIVIRVVKEPASLKAKTTTLVIGQSISLKELITYNGIKGAFSEIDTAGIDFEAVLEQIPEEYFVWDQTEPVSGDTVITAAALIPNKKGVPASGGTVKAADFVLIKTKENGETSTSTAAAQIKINDMSAPAIKTVSAADTSISFTFTPNTTVKELTGEHCYYTVTVRDMVTNGEVELRQRGGSSRAEVIRRTGIVNAGVSMEITGAPDMTVKTPVHSCVVTGLSSNKKYRISVAAHYDTDGVDGTKLENQKVSGTKDVTTRNRLLASENGIEIRYISLTELKKHPDAAGTLIFQEEEKGTDSYGSITVENNETYVLMAQVSNLARALETDKLKWAIASGDKNAATIKAGASTFEAQLKAVRTGTFTVTASSTVTKEVLATFIVTIIPYQSSAGEGGEETQTSTTEPEVAYLGGILLDPFREEKKKAA